MLRTGIVLASVMAVALAGCSAGSESKPDSPHWGAEGSASAAPTPLTSLVASEEFFGDAFALELGDCLAFRNGDVDTGEFNLIDCGEPHHGEVYFIWDVADAPEFDDVAVEGEVYDVCLREFETFVGADYSTSSLDISAFFPSEETWTEDGDREAICLVTPYLTDDLTGSMAGAGI